MSADGLVFHKGGLALCMQALGGELVRRVQQGADAEDVESLERGMIALLGSACRFSLQSGHTEKALGTIQAVLELHFFAPGLTGAARHPCAL